MSPSLPASPTLNGPRLTLSLFTGERISARYLAWLSDPVVNAYSRRLGQPPPTRIEAEQYLASLAPGEAVLAMDCRELGHIGNIKYGPIDVLRRAADISILIGETAAWGRGYGAEAVDILTRWLFDEVGLDRVEAGSANPAFLALVAKLGWRTEGTLDERVMIGQRLLTWTRVALERKDFRHRPEFMPGVDASPAK